MNQDDHRNYSSCAANILIFIVVVAVVMVEIKLSYRLADFLVNIIDKRL